MHGQQNIKTHTQIHTKAIPHLHLNTALIRRTSGRRLRTLNFTLLRTQGNTEQKCICLLWIILHDTRKRFSVFISFPEQVRGLEPNSTHPSMLVMYQPPPPPPPRPAAQQQPTTNFKISALARPSKLCHLFLTDPPQHKIQPTSSTSFPYCILQQLTCNNSPSSNHNALRCFFTTRTIGHNLRTFSAVKLVLARYTEIFFTWSEVFPCFFLSCKANARVKLAKKGHLLFVLFCCFVCYSMNYLCVNVYCNTAIGWQSNCS